MIPIAKLEVGKIYYHEHPFRTPKTPSSYLGLVIVTRVTPEEVNYRTVDTSETGICLFPEAWYEATGPEATFVGLTR